MAEAPVTTDPAGVSRTPTGEITAPPPSSPPTTTPTPAETTKSPTSSTEPPAQPKEEGDGSLLNKDAPKEATGAPKEYADWKVPEGYELDPEIKTEANTLFKEANLSQEFGQKLVDFYIAKTREALNAPFEAYQETRKEWRASAETDPDLRGKLGPGGEVLTTVARALDSL